MFRLLILIALFALVSLSAQTAPSRLASSKKMGEVAGHPQRVNAMPTAVAVSPDGKRVAFVHTAYGAEANDNQQSITLADVGSGALVEYNESKLKLKAKQSFSFGAAFSADSQRLYVPFGSITDPIGKSANDTGNAIGVYDVTASRPRLERLIALPLRDLPPKKNALPLGEGITRTQQVSFPAGIAVFNSGGREKLLIAEQLSDTAAIVDAVTGKLESRIDVGESNSVPSAYPYAAIVDAKRNRGYISLWNGSQVVEIDLTKGKLTRRFSLLPPQKATGASSHPTAMALSRDRKVLYVALANRDQVAAIRLDSDGGKTEFVRTTPDAQKFIGAYPNALALSEDGKLLFAANASQDSVAVISTQQGKLMYLGSLPTQWYPTALAVAAGHLFVATGKGVATGPNGAHDMKSWIYAPKLEYGSIARIPVADALHNLSQSTHQVIESNLYREAQQQFTFATGVDKNPIKHVIYIIKENRTYDQVFGDIKEANGDPGLVMFGEDITPNQHALARQFGVLDNFYDSGEVSGSGHVWSTAAITSDYTERIWPISYRGRERTYDFEGNVSNSIPLELGIPDVNEPSTGYLWSNLARHQRSYRHYGEFVQSTWCGEAAGEAPEALRGAKLECPIDKIEKGMPLPGSGTPSPYPWKIPVLGKNTATKPELEGHFDPQFPDFQLSYPDQLRADEFIREFNSFVSARNLPEFILIRMPNDHTSGAKVGMPTPQAAVADNDLAVGRIVEAVSHSPYWQNTAIFILEDDAQNGADHVDSHRSTALVISKYSPRAQAPKPFIESGFYTTVNMIHTMEALLGLPPMNANDAYAPIMNRMFSGTGDQPAFQSDRRNLDNGLLYEINTPKSEGAKASAKLDFSHADANDAEVLNRILWKAVKGKQREPKPVYRVFPKSTSERDND